MLHDKFKKKINTTAIIHQNLETQKDHLNHMSGGGFGENGLN